ncbi:GIY-YIG nuclease family protein [Ulvibacterium sp.]|uniref:GIY-YIG nuclease family protein n=1 Tax=Ulvibacterium sp. TaxID=2665914 RepID=UPI003BA99C68
MVKNVFALANHVLECGKWRRMYFVYALWSERYDRIYVGFSNDPDRRLREHNSGKDGFTKRYVPWQRFYMEQAEDATEARKKEKYYKSGWGRKRLKSILEEWQSGRMRQS